MLPRELSWNMHRREFIAVVGGAAVLPMAANAQRADRVRRIGVLMSFAENDPEGQARFAAFRESLRGLGWSEGRNMTIEARWTPADFKAMQRSATELVGLQVDVILSATTPTTTALRQQTTTIPIVFANVSDPVGSGFVASLSRPGGNATGFINLEASIAGKWLELLKEIAPEVAEAAVVFNSTTAPYAEYYLNPFKIAGQSLGVNTIAMPVSSPSGLEAAIAGLARDRKGGLIVMPDSFTTAHGPHIISLAAHHRVPAVYPYRSFAKLGGLMSYGIDQHDNFRRAAIYVDLVLKGAEPSELPVQVPVKFELAINMNTAKTLGLNVPGTLVARADEVIE
jgi:putative ABC transport system substrate-binding protein